MLNVYSKNLITLFLSATLLTSCKSPDLEVSSLGKKLPAPALKGSSPFDQSMDSQNYVRVQGSCDSRVGNVFLSFDKSVWHQPPVSPDTTGTSLSGVTNDRDCSDGSFDIYLTKNDLQNIWGIQTGIGASKVDYLYIKGESLIGDTETLTIVDSHPGPNNAPVMIILEKHWPEGFAGANTCDHFRVSVVNSSGHPVPTPTAITFRLEKKVAGTIYTDVPAFSSWSDCYAVNSVPTQTSFTIPANSDGMDLIYKFPANTLNATMEFRLNSPSSLAADINYTPVVLRDSADTSHYRWLGQEEPIYQIYKGICYPLKVRAHKYDRVSVASDSGVTLTVTSSDPQVKFYTYSDCVTEVSNWALASGSYGNTVYVKYQPTGTELESFKDFSVSFSATSYGNTLTYDSTALPMRVDLTDKSSIAMVDIWGPRETTPGMCSAYHIVTTNANHTPIPPLASALLNIELSTVETGVGSFYGSMGCSTGNVITNTGMSAPTASKEVYFMTSGSLTTGTYRLKVSTPGLMTQTREVIVRPN